MLAAPTADAFWRRTPARSTQHLLDARRDDLSTGPDPDELVDDEGAPPERRRATPAPTA